MIRWILRPMALLALCFCVAVGSLVAQPRDDADIYAFFGAPDGCAAPCFLGIRPGVTSEDQARAILSQHPWVGSVTTNPTGISWRWNGKQPRWVSSSFQVTHLDVENRIVTRIWLATDMAYGNFAYIFGEPDQNVFTVTNTTIRYYIIHDGAYLKRGFKIETSTSCPLRTRADLWYSPILISWTSGTPPEDHRVHSIASC